MITKLYISISLSNLLSDKCDTQKVFNYKAANWDDPRQASEQVDLCEIIRHDSDIDHAWENWLSRVVGIVNDKVPTVTIKNMSGPPWIDGQARHLHKVKHTAWSRAKRTNGRHLT